ncbi:MAG: formylglycine-generating enzyme family protein [Candidatus Delongbacteria bacterium]|nr:formylglycine-generating enzyme family protein [Candidatus Delongbacteria bacterium]
MKKLLMVLVIITITCYSAKMNLNYNDGTSTAVFDLNDVEYVQIIENPMVYVQGGTFEMGDEVGDLSSGCRPVHYVTLNDYYIGKYEIAQLEWKQYMPLDVSIYYGFGDNYPAYFMSWYDILVYCNKRSEAEGYSSCYSIGGSTNPDDWGSIPTESDSIWNSVKCNWSAKGYRLPTEAEWEYAARGGIHWSDHYLYSGNNTIDDVAWYGDNNNPIGTKPFGKKIQNQLGIYDMSGNVLELCWDRYDYYNNDYYQICYEFGIVTNPYGPDSGDFHVSRGGCWFDDETRCRTATRHWAAPFGGLYDRGFRVVRTP